MSEPADFTCGEAIKAGRSKVCELRRAHPDDPGPGSPCAPWSSTARAGSLLWISAAVHGDELNGVEIIRRLCRTCAAQLAAR